MKDKLIQYIDLLFAGAEDCADIKQEILQNTLDRYDDLIDEGKSPEAAYRQAISGIGDIGEVLGARQAPRYGEPPTEPAPPAGSERRRLLTAAAVALYILCPIPAIALSELGMDGVIGVCLTLVMIAAATALMILKGKAREPEAAHSQPGSPRQELKKSVESMVWAIGVAMYLAVSFLTGAWYITWLIFLVIPAVNGLIKAILDLMEEKNHEA